MAQTRTFNHQGRLIEKGPEEGRGRISMICLTAQTLLLRETTWILFKYQAEHPDGPLARFERKKAMIGSGRLRQGGTANHYTRGIPAASGRNPRRIIEFYGLALAQHPGCGTQFIGR